MRSICQLFLPSAIGAYRLPHNMIRKKQVYPKSSKNFKEAVAYQVPTSWPSLRHNVWTLEGIFPFAFYLVNEESLHLAYRPSRDYCHV